MRRSVAACAVVALASASACGAFAPPVSVPLPRAAVRACTPGAFALRTSLGRHPLSMGRTAARRAVSGASALRAMFTGIVEEMGKVASLKEEEMSAWDAPEKKVLGVTLTLAAKTVLDGAYEGCSIAVNGVCLTVTTFDKEAFTVGVAPETLRLTNLGDLSPGSPVNLERAAAIDGRNSGHMVQGHVDNVGTILEKWADNESLFVKVQAPRELMKYIVPKGFIAIDGTSLTVCEVNTAESWFTFMLIEYTQKHIIVPGKAVGDKVNLEVDVVSKYVERSLGNMNERLSKIEAALALLDITREDLPLKLPDAGDMFDDEGPPSTTTLLREIRVAAESVDAYAELKEQELSGDSPPGLPVRVRQLRREAKAARKAGTAMANGEQGRAGTVTLIQHAAPFGLD